MYAKYEVFVVVIFTIIFPFLSDISKLYVVFSVLFHEIKTPLTFLYTLTDIDAVVNATKLTIPGLLFPSLL
ncbi:hypothetical protein [Sulfolobus acidocaldarius]|uniref:Uncharacterized protein n=1 Tax=Sulfolobus acidocaldarius TaxID=2285 RepID=A0A0U3FDI0_9CREN|nr:hypothetical protein [Sulfolobus acidocaldarius]ALU28518.1 hypothetical protein ATY89_00040 [Sulfolobus acidocaldarius]ALU31226.1 hypothetical protein ATZ20_03085 [Sulfolobus acidocaldarius]